MGTHASIVGHRCPASFKTRTSGLPVFTIGSMAITIPVAVSCPAVLAKIRYLGIFMHMDADSVSYKIPDHRKPLGFNHALHRGPDIAQVSLRA